jgi:hypothetical protein
MKLLRKYIFFYRIIDCRDFINALGTNFINKEVVTRRKLMEPIPALIMGPSVKAEGWEIGAV